jgi:hypothetical protein
VDDFLLLQSPLPKKMSLVVNPSWRDWKDFCLLTMSIERAGTPLLLRMVEKGGNQREKNKCPHDVLKRLGIQPQRVKRCLSQKITSKSCGRSSSTTTTTLI